MAILREVSSEPRRLLERYGEVRGRTEALCAPLEPEDCVVQSMDDTSPTRWHLAHTTWFFETFLLADRVPPFHPGYDVLFNSYYEAVGERFPRPRRGLLSRPTVREVFAYRAHVDRAVAELLTAPTLARRDAEVLELGLSHEEQHQELILTDIKHVLAQNPLAPPYRDEPPEPTSAAPPMTWVRRPGGIHAIGHAGDGFAYDNEGPRHEVLLRPHELASRPVTNGEYLRFVEDGGYRRPDLWLSDGIARVREEGWQAPLYWRRKHGTWLEWTLHGERPLASSTPVVHVSYFEADAFARWAGARLATEAEWEVAAAEVAEGGIPATSHVLGDAAPHPRPAPGRPDVGDRGAGGAGLEQMFGDVWEWTSSPYDAYPGYRPADGALGEYNGKFMCNQHVLRGGSCATPPGHLRPSYRNFFPAHARWQFSGIRLARDLPTD